MKEHRSGILLTVGIFLPVFITLALFIGVARSEYPERPITVVVGVQAGGPMDMIFRAISVGAEKHLGQPVVIENRPSANAVMGFSVVAAAKPDGYKLAGGSNTALVRLPLLLKVTTFKPLKSFTSILGFVSLTNALVVRKDAPWKTLPELLDYAKKNPGKIKYSASTVGSAMHQVMEYLARKEGIHWVYIPQTGAGPSMIALLGGHVDVLSAGADFVPQSQQGAVRPLVLYEEKRSPCFPDVPILKEFGYELLTEQIFSLHGPAGLPREIVRKLETAFAKGTETPEYKSLVFGKLCCTPVYYNGQDYDRYLNALWFKLEKDLKESGIIKEAASQPY